MKETTEKRKLSLFEIIFVIGIAIAFLVMIALTFVNIRDKEVKTFEWHYFAEIYYPDKKIRKVCGVKSIDSRLKGKMVFDNMTDFIKEHYDAKDSTIMLPTLYAMPD